MSGSTTVNNTSKHRFGVGRLLQRRSLLVIVPDTQPDDVVTVAINQARENAAFVQVRSEPELNESTGLDDSYVDETFREGD